MTTQQLPKRLLVAAIRGYQYFLSPFFGQHCRFYPTCSHYAVEALETHGVWRGSKLAVQRIARCHPLNEGGIDLVPLPPTKTGSAGHATGGNVTC